ncbi:MAG: carboxylesterase family protein [Sphingobacteriales bacterium]|nr:carboxylesterase family protein [Sphingobacteriales bacterium]
MQRVITLLFLIICFLTTFSQTRFKDELFSVKKNIDIQYGSNYDNKNQLTNLLMDVYEPQGDTASVRPIIFFVHGGSFVGGSRNDQSINLTAEYFTKKGYVTANIEYRVQQTTLIAPILDFADTYNWHRAIVRAVQDLKAAIRYIKKDVAQNNNYYRVDTNSIFIYGSSAGAITMLHTVYLNDTLEMNFIFKQSFKELGGLDGNSGNPGYTMKGIKAVVSCSGAIGDLNYINDNRDIQYLAFHNNPDLTVPFDAGCFVTVACWLGQFYGGNRIYPRMINNGTYAEFYPINKIGHPVDQAGDTATYPFIVQKTTDFLYRILNPGVVSSVHSDGMKRLELFPNPSTGMFSVQIPTDIQYKSVTLEIMNTEGQLVYTAESKNKEKVVLNLQLPNGLYVLSMKTDTQSYLSKISIVH